MISLRYGDKRISDVEDIIRLISKETNKSIYELISSNDYSNLYFLYNPYILRFFVKNIPKNKIKELVCSNHYSLFRDSLKDRTFETFRFLCKFLSKDEVITMISSDNFQMISECIQHCIENLDKITELTSTPLSELDGIENSCLFVAFPGKGLRKKHIEKIKVLLGPKAQAVLASVDYQAFSVACEIGMSPVLAMIESFPLHQREMIIARNCNAIFRLLKFCRHLTLNKLLQIHFETISGNFARDYYDTFFYCCSFIGEESYHVHDVETEVVRIGASNKFRTQYKVLSFSSKGKAPVIKKAISNGLFYIAKFLTICHELQESEIHSLIYDCLNHVKKDQEGAAILVFYFISLLPAGKQHPILDSDMFMNSPDEFRGVFSDLLYR